METIIVWVGIVILSGAAGYLWSAGRHRVLAPKDDTVASWQGELDGGRLRLKLGFIDGREVTCSLDPISAKDLSDSLLKGAARLVQRDKKG